MPTAPPIDRAAPLRFIVNAASGRNDAQAKRDAIETALALGGRTGELVFAAPQALQALAREAAAQARATSSAVVAVGGDGTINAVAQAAHAEGCAMGVLPQGTFNYFARTHGLPAEPAEAMRVLLAAEPQPVQVGTVNGRLFLVNASLGLYPVLLEDREAWKARFGRSRLVAFGAALATLLRHHRQLHLRIEERGQTRDVRTPTLFVGNNRLQLDQVGLPQAPALDAGRIAAVMLRPIGTLAMLGLLARGAFGQLGEADDVMSFEFQRMVVSRSRRRDAGRGLKIACDGEVFRMAAPLEFKVADKPLWLMKPSQPQSPDGTPR